MSLPRSCVLVAQRKIEVRCNCRESDRGPVVYVTAHDQHIYKVMFLPDYTAFGVSCGFVRYCICPPALYLNMTFTRSLARTYMNYTFTSSPSRGHATPEYQNRVLA